MKAFPTVIVRYRCTVRPQVAGRMQRTKTDAGGILYFFRLSAFKFPGPNDVYFSCSVDVCPDCNFAVSFCFKGTRGRERRGGWRLLFKKSTTNRNDIQNIGKGSIPLYLHHSTIHPPSFAHIVAPPPLLQAYLIFQNICPANGNLRSKRAANISREADGDDDKRLELYDNIKIDVDSLDYHSTLLLQSESSSLTNFVLDQRSRQKAAESTHCFTGTTLFGITSSIVCLLMALITLTVYITFISTKRRISVKRLASEPRSIQEVWSSVGRH